MEMSVLFPKKTEHTQLWWLEISVSKWHIRKTQKVSKIYTAGTAVNENNMNSSSDLEKPMLYSEGNDAYHEESRGSLQ